MTYLKRAPNFFLAGLKVLWDEGGGRILLGDNGGGGRVMLRSIRFSVLEFGFRLISLGFYLGKIRENLEGIRLPGLFERKG